MNPAKSTKLKTDEEYMAVYERPLALSASPTHYCPGCTHGIAHRLVAEVLDEMGLREKTIGVGPVGCSVFAYRYFNHDYVVAAHGRAPAMATGIKRSLPECTVYTYQGDGDLASIGLAEIAHAALRGENITVIFINNAIYGMTSGQMAPTTLPGMKTTSSPLGRDVEMTGHPLQVAEMISTVEGASYVVRRSLHNAKHIRKAKKAIRMAFETQERQMGFALVELLSSCPINWKLDPIESLKFIEYQMVPVFPVGDYKVHPALTGLTGKQPIRTTSKGASEIEN